MKAVALILALAVITGRCTPGLGAKHNVSLHVCMYIYPCFLHVPIIGCNARAVRQADATVNRWEESVDRFWQYVSELNQQADGVVQTLKTSQLTRELE